ncbi:hypothetical protein MRBLRH8O_000163 [Agrobacterium radiobacter]|uniref:hypothetical protein n=1 Tax=Agrobacterium radiobacter TaxID=362 RepID=UPI003466836C
MASTNTKDAIIDLMRDYDRVFVHTVTCDEISSALRIKKSFVLKSLQELIIEGKIEYARKNPRSAQSRFQLAGEALSK